MRAFSIFRAVFGFLVLSVVLSCAGVCALGQDVGSDVIGGAGIFRPKNPESKKRTVRTTTTRRGTVPRTTGASTANADKVEDLLDKGNQFRDAQRFAEAENSYQSILKISAKD